MIGQEKRRDFVFRTHKVKTYAKNLSQGHWTFLGLGDEKKWYGKGKYPLEKEGDSVASQMVQRFKETNHPAFTSANALSRGILRKMKRKKKQYTSMWTLQTRSSCSKSFHSVNQLSTFGAGSTWCEQFRKLVAVEAGKRDVKGNTSEDPSLSSHRKCGSCGARVSATMQLFTLECS